MDEVIRKENVHLPPGPYEYETTRRMGRSVREDFTGHVYLLDGNGRRIASILGTADEKMALAKLILDARDKHS